MHKNLYCNVGKDIHMSFKNYEASDYGHVLDLLIISH